MLAGNDGDEDKRGDRYRHPRSPRRVASLLKNEFAGRVLAVVIRFRLELGVRVGGCRDYGRAGSPVRLCAHVVTAAADDHRRFPFFLCFAPWRLEVLCFRLWRWWLCWGVGSPSVTVTRLELAEL